MAIRYLSGINVDTNTLFVDASNDRVGIGTTSPLTKLDVRGSTYISGYTVGFDTNPQGNYAYRLTNDGGNSFLNVQGGNVGIGTTSPTRKFVVSSAGASGIEIEPNYVAGVSEILSYNRATSVYETMRLNGGDFEFQIGGSETVTISGAGAVKFNNYSSTNNTGTPTYLLGTDASGNIVKTNTVPGSAAGPYLPLAGGTMTGVTQFNDHTQHGDQVYAKWGASNDLQIYHDGSNSYINETGTGVLSIQSDGTEVQINKGASEYMARFITDGAVNLYYDNSKKFETTSTGVTVTGYATASEFYVVNNNFGLDTSGNYLEILGYDGFKFRNSQFNTVSLTIEDDAAATFAGTVTAPTFLGDLNGTINTVTTAVTKANATNDTTVATTAFVQNLIGTIPAGLVFQGTWNAATNTPTLTSGTGTTGNFYIVSVDGSTNLDGITDWKVGDWPVFVEQGATDAWEKVDNSSVLDGSGTGQTVALWSGSGTSNTLTDSRFTQTSTSNQAKAPAGAGTRSFEALDSSGNSDFHVLGSGEVVIPNNYLFVSASQGAYFTGNLRARGGISNDLGTLSLGGNGDIGNLTLTSNTLATFAGTVNIGSSLSSEKLEVGGTIRIRVPNTSSATLLLNNTDTQLSIENTGGNMIFTSPGAAERLRITSTGNVGIGTTAATAPGFWYDATNKYLAISHWTTSTPPTPAAMLHLSGNANNLNSPQIRIEGRENPGDTKLDIAVSDANVRFNLVENSGDTAAGYGLMTFKTNAEPQATYPSRGGFLFQVGSASVLNALLITNQGNVGIGTTAPGAKLDVNGNIYNSSGAIFTNTIAGYSTNVVSINTNTNFYVPSGNVGIGTTAPFGTAANRTVLSVNGTTDVSLNVGTGGSQRAYLYGSSTYADLGTIGSLPLVFSPNNTERMRISSAGAIKFNAYDSTSNTGTPTYLLGTDASGNVVKTLSTPSPITSQAASLYDLIPNGAFTTTYAFTSTAGVYAEVMESNDVITATGTYSVQVFVSDYAVGGTQYTEYYSGVMSWYAASTNDDGGGAISEISLHRAGHAANTGVIYLRTRETIAPDNVLKLEVMCNKTYTGASDLVFKFVRLI
jgi:hypothetical protein